MKSKTITAIAAFLLAGSSHAQNTVSTKATAQLAAACQIFAANIDLGEMIPGQTASSSTANFSVKCTRSTALKYYIAYRQYGWDCAFLEGANKKDRVLYGIRDMQTNGAAANNILTPIVANGDLQLLSFKAEIQPLWGGNACPTPYKAPGKGYNPYITPDDYSDNIVFGIVY